MQAKEADTTMPGMRQIIHVTAFVVSFALGVFLVYTLEPTKQQVWVYASPKNASKLQYKTPDQRCFQPKIESSDCTMTAQSVDEPPSFLSSVGKFF